jgi:hypothetical protein
MQPFFASVLTQQLADKITGERLLAIIEIIHHQIVKIRLYMSLWQELASTTCRVDKISETYSYQAEDHKQNVVKAHH